MAGNIDIKKDESGMKEQLLTTSGNLMKTRWEDYCDPEDTRPVTQCGIREKAAIAGHIGILMLSCGTGAWRVRQSVNMIAGRLGLVCSCNIGLKDMTLTFSRAGQVYTVALSLPSTGVNTDRLTDAERYVSRLPGRINSLTCHDVHGELAEIENKKPNYSAVHLGLAAGTACCGFTFLLGGGPVEMLCALIGAGLGNFVKTMFARRHFTLLLSTTMGVFTGCLVYGLTIRLLEIALGVPAVHEAGYICAVLFVIPGFPLITGFIDMVKQDMRSGLERLTYAVMIIVTATAMGWLIALVLQLEPRSFPNLGLSVMTTCILRLAASFVGVFGFSIMFNSPLRLAATAAMIGAIANTLRLELVDLGDFPAAAASFLGALTAGLLAQIVNSRDSYPRIGITVPSIVIMVPGLYMYTAFYDMGSLEVGDGVNLMMKALLMVLALPMGLITARFLTDPVFRRNV